MSSAEVALCGGSPVLFQSAFFRVIQCHPFCGGSNDANIWDVWGIYLYFNRVHPSRLIWNIQPSPTKGKEHDLKQNSMIYGTHDFIFRVVLFVLVPELPLATEMRWDERMIVFRWHGIKDVRVMGCSFSPTKNGYFNFHPQVSKHSLKTKVGPLQKKWGCF